MLRLFGVAGVLVLISGTLALITESLLFRIATPAIALLIYAVYWVLRRSLPRRHGRLRLPGLREPVAVYRDDHGVPHIYARNLHDLYLAQGYVTAQDRLWTMDLHRRTASGQMAEVFGPSLLALDKHFRTIGLRRAAAASLTAYAPATLDYLEAYAAGVNARIAEGKLPWEFSLLGYKPAPWSPVDTLALGKYMAYDLSSDWAGKLFRAQLVQTVGAEKAAELFWLPPDMDELQTIEDVPLPDLAGLFEAAAATVREVTGSNCWAVAGSRSRSGAPLLASDPHLSMKTPAIWYQSHLIGPDGLDVIGAAFPGVPGITLGQNREIAWGMTVLNASVQDVMVEQRNIEHTNQFRYGERWEEAELIHEEIRVKGQPPHVHDVLVTRNGPVIAAGIEAAVSLRWTALQPTAEIEAFLAMNRARSWPEFRDALRRYEAPPQRFLFAGKDGTIASRVGGRLPLGNGGPRQTLVPGWRADAAWSGVVPFDDLPEVVNPPEGFLVGESAPDTPRPYRAQRVTERLQGTTGITLEKLQALQTECVNLQARSLLQILLNSVQEGLRHGHHAEALTDTEKQAMLMISGWDCCETPDLPAPALWHQWYLFLVEGMFRSQMGLELFDRFLVCGMAGPIADRLVRQVAEGHESRWLDREGENSLSRVALRSFRRAVALLAAKYGANPDRWRWGKEHQISFAHPLGERTKWLRPFLRLGPYPLAGSATAFDGVGYTHLAPFQASVAAPWRQVVDLSLLDEAREILAPGQSENPLSPHYSDQMTAWLRSDYYPRLFKHNEIRRLPCLLLEPLEDHLPPVNDQSHAAD